MCRLKILHNDPVGDVENSWYDTYGNACLFGKLSEEDLRDFQNSGGAAYSIVYREVNEIKSWFLRRRFKVDGVGL